MVPLQESQVAALLECFHPLLVCICRCILQLTVLGYLLMPVFSYNAWWLVLLYAAGMLAVAAAETVSRPAASYKVTVHSTDYHGCAGDSAAASCKVAM